MTHENNPPLEDRDAHWTRQGPLYCAIASAVVPAGQLLAFPLGLRVSMFTVLAIIIPSVTVATLLLAVSIGWIFILIGRQHRRPSAIVATSIFIGVTMVELLGIVAVAAAGNGG